METGEGESRYDRDHDENVNHVDMCKLSEEELDEGWENQDANWSGNKYRSIGEEKERDTDDIWGEDKSVPRD